MGSASTLYPVRRPRPDRLPNNIRQCCHKVVAEVGAVDEGASGGVGEAAGGGGGEGAADFAEVVELAASCKLHKTGKRHPNSRNTMAESLKF